MNIPQGSNYARDPNHAENARHDSLYDARLEPEKPPSTAHMPPLVEDVPWDGSKSTFKTCFRSDAKIWELYLDDAERVAKERVALWQTWLDSLLIFAGLFAGVLASFLVNATDGSNDSNPSPPPSTRSLWTTGLWCCSLVITIFGAIMGVLAKAWISNFIPVSSRKEARDAYTRLLLNKQAERWHHLFGFVGLILLASLLFVLGFAIKLFDTNTNIGIVVSCLVGIGVLTYLFNTITAMLSPRQTFPFRTPLSDLLSFVIQNLVKLIRPRNAEHNPQAGKKHGVDDDLAEIWLEKLIKSPNPSTANEAFLELARQWNTIDDQWHNYFCRADVLRILLRRHQIYMIPGAYYKAGTREELCLHIECFMRILQHVELTPTLLSDSSLQGVLTEYLEPGGPFNRWNVFQEDVRPLAFSARMQAMMLMNQAWSTPGLPKKDLSVSEVEEQPWESIFKNTRGSHRFTLIVSSSRGMIEGEKNMQTASLHVLSLFLAQASVSGLYSEPNANVHGSTLDISKRYIPKYLLKMGKAEVGKWESVVVALKSDEIINQSLAICIPGDIGVLLLHQEKTFRYHGILIMEDVPIWAFQSDSTEEIIKHYNIQYIISNIIFNDEDTSVRERALEFVVKLLQRKKDNTLKHKIELMMANSLKDRFRYQSRRDTAALSSLIKINEVDDSILSITTITEDSVTELTKIVFANKDRSTRENVAKIIKKLLLRHDNFQNTATEIIRNVLTQVFDDLDGHDKWSTYIHILHTTHEFLKEFKPLRTCTEVYIKTFIINQAFYNKSFSDVVSYCAQNWLKRFIATSDSSCAAHDNTLPDQINIFETLYNDNINVLTGLLTDNDSGCDLEHWNNTVYSIFQSRLISDIESEDWLSCLAAINLCQNISCIPNLIRIGMTSENDTLKWNAMDSLTEIINKTDSIDLHVSEAMTSSFGLVVDNLFSETLPYEKKLPCLEIVGSVLTKFDFPAGFQMIALGIINSSDDEIRLKATDILCTVVAIKPQNIQYNVITPASENLVLSLKPTADIKGSFVTIRWLELLTSLKQYFRDAEKIILNIISPIMEELEHDHNHEFSNLLNRPNTVGSQGVAESIIWVRIMGFLAANFPDAMREALPDMIHMAANHNNKDVRVAAIKSLVLLATIAQFQKTILEYFLENPKSVLGLRDELHLRIKAFEFFALNEQCVFLEHLLQIATASGNESNKYARMEAVKSLTVLSKFNGNVKLQDSLKLVFDGVAITKDTESEVLLEWVELYMSMAQKKIRKAVTFLVDIANKELDVASAVRLKATKSLTSLINLDGSFIKELLNDIELDFGQYVQYEVVLAWGNLITVLAESGWKPTFSSQVIKTSVTHHDIRTKSILLHILQLHSRWDELPEQLAKVIETELRNQDRFHVECVVSTIGLIATSTLYDEFIKRTIISDVLPFLLELKMSKEEYFLNDTIETLFGNIIDHCQRPQQEDSYYSHQIFKTLILAIPRYIPSITENGMKFAIQLVKSVLKGSGLFYLKCDMEVTAKILSSFLKKDHSLFAHTTVLELLAALFSTDSDLLWSYDNLKQTVISDITSLAIDTEKHDSLRILSFKTAVISFKRSPVDRPKLSRYQKRLMLLLENSDIGYATAELLSAMAIDSSVRRDILSEIISYSTGTSQDAQLLEGQVILLLRLILDKRLMADYSTEPMDSIALLLAFTLVQRPGLNHLKFPMTSALWRNYRRKATSSIFMQGTDLVNWFCLALFGRHITLFEAMFWNKMNAGKQWLLDSGADTPGQDDIRDTDTDSTPESLHSLQLPAME